MCVCVSVRGIWDIAGVFGQCFCLHRFNYTSVHLCCDFDSNETAMSKSDK